MKNDTVSQDLPSVSGEYISPDKVPTTDKKKTYYEEEKKVPIIQLSKRTRSLSEDSDNY